MKKKLLATVLCISLTATLFVGCGSSNDVASNDTNTESIVSEMDSNAPEDKTENGETEKVSANYTEEVDTFMSIYIENTYFHLNDNTLQELETMLTEKNWANTSYDENEVDFFKNKMICKYRSNEQIVALEIVRPEEIELSGGITANFTIEEVISLWGEPNYIYEDTRNQNTVIYYLHSSGSSWVEFVFGYNDGVEKYNEQKLNKIALCYISDDWTNNFESVIMPDTENVLRTRVKHPLL